MIPSVANNKYFETCIRQDNLYSVIPSCNGPMGSASKHHDDPIQFWILNNEHHDHTQAMDVFTEWGQNNKLALGAHYLQQHEPGTFQVALGTPQNLEAKEEFVPQLGYYMSVFGPSVNLGPYAEGELEADPLDSFVTSHGDEGLDVAGDQVGLGNPQDLEAEEFEWSLGLYRSVFGPSMTLGSCARRGLEAGPSDSAVTSPSEDASDVADYGQITDQDHEKLLDEHKNFDMEFEKYLIVKHMLGNKSSIDDLLAKDLDFLVGVHKSFRTGDPQHCRQDCLDGLASNDPQECCWNTKFTQARSSMKKAFQTDITACITEYLKIEEKKTCSLPLHCTTALREWVAMNYDNPYMSKTKTFQMAEEYGLTETQIRYWLENWRARTWKPTSSRQCGRKGKHFRHLKEETTKIKDWILKMERYPTREEAKILSSGSTMTPRQIHMWCCNFRKRNKIIFRNWGGKVASRNTQ